MCQQQNSSCGSVGTDNDDNIIIKKETTVLL